MRLPDGRLHPKAIGGPGAKNGHILVWKGTEPKWQANGGGTVAVTSFARERFVLSLTGAQDKALAAIPAANSAHVHLDSGSGMRYLDESVDYTISDEVISLLSAAGASSGDILDVRYVIAAAIILTAYPTAVLADSPALYWRFGESSGTTAADSSGNARHGTYTSVTLGALGLVPGDADTCVTFSGSTSERVEIAYAAWMDTADLTVEAIVSTSASGSNDSIIDRDDGGNRVFQFRMNGSNKLEFVLIGTSVVVVAGATSINDGLPHHVAATYDGADINLYVDGVLDGTTATAVALPTAAARILAGVNNSSGYQQAWDGEIDEVAVYTTALTGGQIAAHFAASGL